MRRGAICLQHSHHRIGRAFADFGSIEINSAHARLRRKRDEVHTVRRFLTRAHRLSAQAEFFFCQHHDGTPFGSLIGKRSELRGFG